LTTKQARLFLAQHGIGVSTTIPLEAQRVITINITIWCQGFTCSVIKFGDNKFKFKEQYCFN